VSDGLGCKIYDSVMVFVDSIMNPYVNLDTTFCQGEILALQKHQNSYNLEWVNYPNQSQITINSSGKYKAVLSNQLCKDTFEVNVNILDTLKASIVHLGDLDVYCFKSETASLKILIENPTNYTSIWMHNSSREIEIEVTEPGIYTAQVSNGTCISTISTNVVEHCKPLFFVPNAFTPNNDDLNDVFMPQHSGLFQEYKMEIFNRWGELIYTTNELNTGWDGKIAGKDIQADVFVYKIYFSYLNEKDFLHRENLVGTVTMYR
jgi:gliding motility-associated-like protein